MTSAAGTIDTQSDTGSRPGWGWRNRKPDTAARQRCSPGTIDELGGKYKFIPGEEERDDGHGKDATFCHRNDHAHERSEPREVIDARQPLDGRKVAEIPGQHPCDEGHGDGQGNLRSGGVKGPGRGTANTGCGTRYEDFCRKNNELSQIRLL